MSYRKAAETAAIAGALTAIATAFLLFKSGVIWQGSVSQLHSACSTAGIFTYLGGADAVSACDHAGTAYGILWPLFVVSVIAAVGGLVLTWISEVAAHREARREDSDK